MQSENEIKIFGRIIPESGKIHQNQEVFSPNGICSALKATSYKEPFKVLIEVSNEEKRK